MQQSCEANRFSGTPHDGTVKAYIRICPAGHWRRGHACEACAGNGALICTECAGDHPAVLILTEIWHQLVAEVAEAQETELIADGAGPLLDPDCRDGKCGSCVGAPCEHECHRPGPR